MSVVKAYVSLWLSGCLFGCVLLGPITLKVQYYELMLGTNEILASKHDIAALKVKQGL